MEASNVYLIAIAEIIAVLLFACALLVMQNRNLRLAVRKLQSRIENLVKDIRLTKSAQVKKPTENPQSTYHKNLTDQLDIIRNHHASMEPDRDISLDIDPSTPLERRVAAMRYALLRSELEAASGKYEKNTNWPALQRRYEQLFNFLTDYAAPDTSNEEELTALQTSLDNAKKRINNLERFQSLYFDLEEKWEAAKNKAKTHFDEISQLTADSSNASEIESALQSYHNSYGELGALIETDIDQYTSTRPDSDNHKELQRLRTVAADQHRIITELERKLKGAKSSEEREEIVSTLQGELKKHLRYAQESETCIQLLEDELTNTHKELEKMRRSMNKVIQLKTDLKTLRDENDDFEMELATLKSENRRLNKELKDIRSAPTNQGQETQDLKKELSDLELRYSQLEEKYLDLKLQG